jgi:hypothetical protein
MKFDFKYIAPYDYFGQAIDRVYMNEEGEMWVTNGEYATQVNFCPFTGVEAIKKMKVVDSDSKYKVYENQ